MRCNRSFDSELRILGLVVGVIEIGYHISCIAR